MNSVGMDDYVCIHAATSVTNWNNAIHICTDTEA